MLPEFMGVRYTPTIIQLGRAQIKFGLGRYQALECDGLLRHRPRVQMKIKIHLQIQNYGLIFT